MRKRGFTLTELLVAMGLMAFTFGAISSLFVFGLRSFQATTTDTNINQTNAQGLRRVAETLRSGMSLSISTDGRTITYSVPRLSNVVDPQTGEKEFLVPLVADGAARSFTVTTAGNLVDSVGNRIVVRNIRLTDPDANSSQFGQAYKPFTLTTVGSERAVTLNLITSETVHGKLRYARLKTTVVLHNR